MAKVYENSLPRSVMERGLKLMKESGTDFFGMDSVDDVPFVDPDESVTTRVDALAYEPVKMRALAAHAIDRAQDIRLLQLRARTAQLVPAARVDNEQASIGVHLHVGWMEVDEIG